MLPLVLALCNSSTQSLARVVRRAGDEVVYVKNRQSILHTGALDGQAIPLPHPCLYTHAWSPRNIFEYATIPPTATQNVMRSCVLYCVRTANTQKHDEALLGFGLAARIIVHNEWGNGKIVPDNGVATVLSERCGQRALRFRKRARAQRNIVFRMNVFLKSCERIPAIVLSHDDGVCVHFWFGRVGSALWSTKSTHTVINAVSCTVHLW